MSIYTKRGDRGITDMAHAGNISKSDDRIRLMGEADELNSHIELVKSMLRQSEILQFLERIQKNLDLIAAGVSFPIFFSTAAFKPGVTSIFRPVMV